VGTVGGGALEHAVIAALERVRESGQAEFVTHDLGRDLAMCCGGRMEVFVEPVHATPRLVLFGAGHVAVPTAALARDVGFEVLVVDEREDLNSEARFPGCQLVQRDPSEWLERSACDARDWLLICTHSHHLDEQILERCLRQDARYIGMVGSRRKVYRLIQRVAAKSGGNLPSLDRVYAPVGLDLGAVTPAEIAVSIVSELIALRRGRAASHLRAIGDARLQEILSEPTSE
jgi:xanthine dehydrogenase accessory factor